MVLRERERWGRGEVAGIERVSISPAINKTRGSPHRVLRAMFSNFFSRDGERHGFGKGIVSRSRRSSRRTRSWHATYPVVLLDAHGCKIASTEAICASCKREKWCDDASFLRLPAREKIRQGETLKKQAIFSTLVSKMGIGAWRWKRFLFNIFCCRSFFFFFLPALRPSSLFLPTSSPFLPLLLGTAHCLRVCRRLGIAA